MGFSSYNFRVNNDSLLVSEMQCTYFQKIRIDVTDKDGNTARLFYFRVTLWLRKLTEKTYI
ncbi:hypothetical protein C1S99_07805 [Vibrio parahaemolyticus]|nr:hypothetical protein BGM07_001460 [Vibrio parahaemolyticus]KCV73738.1 hypothetical protein Y011_22350 [Vibrio parahaemolyticus VP49]AWA90993.1 hypothetical protein BSG32_18255 [Vibrio parahaemolyticus]EGQ8178973.1 hypothetical protein [Vibrio parahaemolyticus]EGQ9344724.1 hypothetical protein [Vibrio parahaemolyticus]